MRHVKAIKADLIDKGQHEDAHHALDDLLSMGPHNIEALKLKAMLYGAEGRYDLEANTWIKILDVDREDLDAIEFVQRMQFEDREHFYFSEELPDKSIRFLAYPRSLITVSVVGLFGCMIFLALAKLGQTYPIIADQRFVIVSFCFLVLVPWVAIVFTYCKSMRHIIVNKIGIEVATRLYRYSYRWTDILEVGLYHRYNKDSNELYLIIIPINSQHPVLKINFDDDTSSVRAKSYLVREINRLFHRISYAPLDQLGLKGKKVISH